LVLEFDEGDDLVGIGSEGLRVTIDLSDEAVDVGLKIDGRVGRRRYVW